MKSKILSDVALNIIASILPVFTLQFLLLPVVASKIDSNSFGQLLTIVALMNISAATLGSILNNLRLINFKRYEELKIEGDFKILLGMFFVINTCIMFFGLWYFEKTFNVINITLIMVTATFLLLKGYGNVEFRIKLNFKYILMDSIFLVIGYVIGFILFLISGYWEVIYFCGFASSLVYIFSKTSIFREPFKRTDLFRITTSQTIYFLVSGLLLGIITYADRILLYPLMGGVVVSIYYTATILGKTISLVVQPIAGVLLSYLAQLKTLDNNNVYILLGLSLVAGGIGYVITILISKPILTFLYPQYVDEALNYINVTTLAIMVTIVSNMLNPVLLKFCNLKWQIVINLFYISAYIFLSLFLLDLYGLMGFCVGILIASIIKLFAMLIIYYLVNIKENVINDGKTSTNTS